MISKRNATYQDVLDALDAPEHLVAELLDGDLVLSPWPGGTCCSVTSMLGGELLPPFRNGVGGPGGWVIVLKPELRLGANVLVPDLAGWRLARMPSVPETFTVVPDWVCEVASPSTEKLDRGRKLPLYAAAGVAHAWMVHPQLRMLEVLRLHAGQWLSVGVYIDDEKVRAEPFDAIELDLANLWLGLPLRASEPGEDELHQAW